MVCVYHEVNKEEEELVELCETTELGTTPSYIGIAALKLGLEATTYKNAKLERIKILLNENIPVIVLIDPAYLYGGIEGFGHFVVVLGLEENKVIYHDPDVPNGEYKECEVENFVHAWNSLGNWIVEVRK